MLLSPNPQTQPAFKKDFTCLLNGNKQVRLVAVNADQDRTFNSGFRKGHAQVTNQLPVAFLDGQAVKGEGVEEVAEEVVRDGKSQAFPPANCPDADCAVSFDGCVPLPFADEEESKRLFEVDSARKFFVFSFGVAGSDEADGSASHLGADDAFNLVVGMFLKGASGKGFAAIPADGRQSVADLLKGVQGCLKVIVVLNQDWDSALNCFVHCLTPPLILTQKVKGAFICWLKPTAPCARFLWGVSQVIRQAQSMLHFHHLLKRSSDSVNGQSSRQNFLNVNGHFSESSEHPLNQGSFVFVNIHDFSLIDGYPFAFVALSQKLGVHSPKGSPVLFPLLVSGSQVGRFFENLFANVHASITASNYSARQSSKNCERLGAREHENLELSNACTLTRMHADTKFLRGKRVAVIGVGNRMRGDDGVGSVIAERLQELAKGNLLVIDAETVPENYLGVLLDSKPEVALFIDAVDFGGEVGEWALVPLSVLGDKVPTTHTVSLKLLGQILESNGIECLLLAIQPKQIGFGAPMSEEVASVAERIVQMLAQVFGLAVSRPAEMSGEVHGDE
jgi:hydrogenase 3 maturation protease